ncbi:putative phosphoserine phosphatase [Helianthus annuus]|nr:putative phosphoserine phosphatase [Helianthus annuus]
MLYALMWITSCVWMKTLLEKLWTARAMGGSVPFQEVLAARLNLFNPSSSTFFRSDPQGMLLFLTLS